MMGLHSVQVSLTNSFCRPVPSAKSANDTTELAEIERLRQKHPDRFEMFQGKECWNKGVDIDNHIDVLMHLLFLGLTKTVLETVHDFLARKLKMTAFLQQVEGRLESIDGLGLHWARLQGYRKGTFGGWIGENFLDFTRILMWFFSDMTDLLADPPFVEPAGKERKDWLKADNAGWLACRGLPTTGKADELRQRVNDYMEQEGGPPPRLEEIELGENHVLELLHRFGNVIELALTREVTDDVTENLSCRIKVRLASQDAVFQQF